MTYLQVSGSDSLDLEILGGISCQLEDLGGEILEDGGAVDGRGGAHPAVAGRPVRINLLSYCA